MSKCPQCNGEKGYQALCMTTYDPNYNKLVWVNCALCKGTGEVSHAKRASYLAKAKVMP